MDFLCRLIPVVGMGMFLLVAPLLALVSLFYAVRQGGLYCFLGNFFAFIFYPAWLGFGFYLLLLPQIKEATENWWVLLITLFSLAAAIPHIGIWVNGRREDNRRRTLAGIFGTAAIISATVGVGLLCYSGRFY